MLPRNRRGPSTQTAAAAQAGDQVLRPAHPEDRRPDQQVAQGAAADAGDRGEEAEGDDVVLAPAAARAPVAPNTATAA
jgi:hypothetical protein